MSPGTRQLGSASWSEAEVTENIHHTGTSWLARTCWLCFLLVTDFVFLETFLDFLLSHQRKDPELFAAWGIHVAPRAAGSFFVCILSPGLICMSVFLPRTPESYLQSRGVSPGSSSRVPSLHASSHQAPSKCFFCNETKALGERVWEGVSWKWGGGGSWHRFRVPWWLWLLPCSPGSWACDP